VRADRAAPGVPADPQQCSNGGQQKSTPSVQHVPSGRQQVPAVGQGLVWPAGQQPTSVHSSSSAASQQLPVGGGKSLCGCARGLQRHLPWFAPRFFSQCSLQQLACLVHGSPRGR
jgi:hypothetical protein